MNKILIILCLLWSGLTAYANDGILISKPGQAPQKIETTAPTVPSSSAAPSGTLEGYVNELVQQFYPKVIEDVVNRMRLNLNLDLTIIHFEQWVYHTAVSAFEDPAVKQAIQDAKDQGAEEARKAKQNNVSDDLIPQRIKARIQQIFSEQGVQKIIFEKARVFIQPIIEQQQLESYYLAMQEAQKKQQLDTYLRLQEEQRAIQQNIQRAVDAAIEKEVGQASRRRFSR